LQTHTIPEDDTELRRIAIRLGYVDKPENLALTQFKADLKSKTELNRKILDHLLHDAFKDDELSRPESDLVLDPEPSPDLIREILERYGFRDVHDAYTNLMALATEKIPFLSTRRCRHFLASIAPHLLQAIASTPDPDATLVSLSTLVIPIVALVLGRAFLDETVTPMAVMGIATILAGVTVAILPAGSGRISSGSVVHAAGGRTRPDAAGITAK